VVDAYDLQEQQPIWIEVWDPEDYEAVELTWLDRGGAALSDDVEDGIGSSD
jgi:hypothetical protein